MSESRKRKLADEGQQYRQEVAAKEQRVKRLRQSRELGKEINTDLSDLFGKMSASTPPVVGVDVDMAARGRRRKSRKTTKKSKKKSRKTRKH